MPNTYFPQGIALGDTFCNRTDERKLLRSKIEANEHTVLMAPRRYGKTSLMAQVLHENNFPGLSIDFFFTLNQNDVSKLIVDGVSDLMLQLMPKGKAAAKKLLDALQSLYPSIAFSFFGHKLELHTQRHDEKSITDTLLALDQLATQAKQSCVLIFDEFQQVGELHERHAIEAAIRHAVERSHYVSYIFCGSKRHLLNRMFSDKSRPLYHLCDLMTIDRIHSSCYHSFLNNLAMKRWSQSLNSDVITTIIELTENHPYYINALCRNLWKETKPPAQKDVTSAWKHYVEQQSPWIMTDISELTLNRRKVLQAFAQTRTKEAQGAAFLNRVSMSHGSVKQAIDALIAMDLIYQDYEGYYSILDPAMSFFLRCF